MEQFYTLLTEIGKAKIANATALQTKINFTKLLVGDSSGSYYEPTETQTKLKNKVWEGGIGNISVDKDNPNWIVLESVIPSNVGGFTIRELGILDEEGDLVVIAKYPATYKPQIADGSTKDLIIKTILEVTNASSVTLKVDPTIVLATKKDIENVKKEVTESTLSKEDIQTTINNIKASDIKTSSGATVESQLADITTQQGDLQNLKTTDKTNIVGAVNELFQNANNGKQNWVDVIGSPLNIEDTFSTLKNKTQNLKNSMAEKLTTKGQDSKGIEDLQVLINKIDMLNSYDIDMLFLKYEIGRAHV